MKTIWLIYNEKDASKNSWYIKEYQKEGENLSIQVKLILIERLSFGVGRNGWYVTYDGIEEKAPVAAIVRTIYPLLSTHLECMGTRVFNRASIAAMCNDKAKTYQALVDLRIPLIPTEFVKKTLLREKLNNHSYPCVVKTVDGHGGSEVYLITKENHDEMIDQINVTTQSDVVLQPLIGKAHKDLRVYVIGQRIIACILRTAKEGFNSNFSLGGEVSSYQLSEKEQELIHTIIREFEFDLVGIDFLIDDDGSLIFNEIEDVVGARMLYQCTEINLVREYLLYIKECMNHIR